MPINPVLPSQLLDAVLLRQDRQWGLSVLGLADLELRVPQIDAAIGAHVRLAIDPRDVAIALTRPMDVSITNRLPGRIAAIEALDLPYARVVLDVGGIALTAALTQESVDRLALEPGLDAWAMIKAVALARP